MRPKNDGTKSITSAGTLDGVKWAVILMIIAAGIVANGYFSEVAGAIRAAAGIIVAIVVLGIASLTAKGQRAWSFIKGSRTELRKVVWPTRQETVQTALVVVGMVIVTAIILWAVDSLFFWAISFVTTPGA